MLSAPHQENTSSDGVNDASQRSHKRKRPGTDVSSRATGTYGRKKAQNACFVCRARKTKCDNELPICGFCKATGGECHYSAPTSLRYDQASLAILQRLNSLESNLGSLIQNLGHEKHAPSCLCPNCRTPNNPSESARNGHIDVNDLLNASSSGAPTSPPHHVPEPERPPSSEALFRASSDISIESMLHWHVFTEPLSHLHQVPLVKELGYSMSDSNDRMSGNEELDLNADVVYPLVENFIVNNLPSNPILDPVLLRQQVQVIIEQGLGWDGESCLVLLVLALGSISSSTDLPPSGGRIRISRGDSSFRAAETYFKASQLRIGTLYCEEDHLLSASCAFFTAVYLSFTMRIMAAWKAFAQAGTQCLAHLTAEGLMDHQLDENVANNLVTLATPTSARKYDALREQRVLEDSLYWVILKGEAELCLELGLPGSALHDSRYPHIFPRPPNLEDLGSSPGSMTMHSIESDRKHFVTGWFYYLGEISLKRLQNRILQYRYGDRVDAISKGSEIDNEDELARRVDEFDEQLSQWLQSLPETLRFSATTLTEHLHDHLRWVLRAHYIELIDLIRFPAIRSVLTAESSFPNGPYRLSPATLRLAQEWLDNAVARIDVHVEEFLHRHQGSWLTIRGCTRSALALLGAKLKCQESARSLGIMEKEGHAASLDESILPPRWRDAVVGVLGMLRAWEGESGDLQRLRVIVETLLGFCDDGGTHMEI